MGYVALVDMLDIATYNEALNWHLTSNHFPPIPRDFFPSIKQAIEAVRNDESDFLITLPNACTLEAGEIVQRLHLEPFVYYTAEVT